MHLYIAKNKDRSLSMGIIIDTKCKAEWWIL
jgi:hypothetical protein